jgi:hypothetical protein
VRRALGSETSLTLEQARDTARALTAELTGETKPLPLVPETQKPLFQSLQSVSSTMGRKVGSLPP